MRERPSDIPLLIEHFLRTQKSKLGREVRGLDEKTQEMMRSYSWPGNVRELQNVIERWAIVSGSSDVSIVLVHGAFADGSSWDKVIPLLQAKGLKVVAVQNPLTSLADDVASAKRVIDAQSGPVILVGHSWAGAVILAAAEQGVQVSQ